MHRLCVTRPSNDDKMTFECAKHFESLKNNYIVLEISVRNPHPLAKTQLRLKLEPGSPAACVALDSCAFLEGIVEFLVVRKISVSIFIAESVSWDYSVWLNLVSGYQSNPKW